jgi:putative hemolysin
MVLVAVLVIGFLILVNALYVAAEFSAVSVRRHRIIQLAEEGHWLARRLRPIVESPAALDRYVAAAQIGITLASLMLGAYGQSALAPVLVPLFRDLGGLETAAAHSTAALVVLLTLTVAQMVLGELVPKSIALQFPNKTAMFTLLPMSWSLRVFRPFIGALNGSGRLLLKLAGLVPIAERHIHSPEEIELLIAESGDGGVLEPEERRRLNRALRLGARSARQLMTPRAKIVALDLEAPVEAALRTVQEQPFTRFPVYRHSLDESAGFLHAKDLLLRVARGRRPVSLKELLRPLLSVGDTTRADRLLALLREHRTQQALVTDAQGKVVGLVTIDDVLAEVFGHLGDELKAPPAEPKKSDERLVPGRAH